MIRLFTLGALDLRHDNGTELGAVLAQPRRMALLAFLAVATPHGFHRRDRILPLFWPERDTDSARASLNRAVYFLRRALGDKTLLSRGDEELGLDRERVWCDAGAFDEALELGSPETAVALYRGELLPGFFVSGAGGFEEWLEQERGRRRQAASDAAWRLAERDEAAGNFSGAARWARQGVALEPLEEAAFRHLLALLDRSGDRAGAVQAYARFADELAAELDLAPSPETRALYEAIRIRTGRLGERAPARDEASPVIAAPPTPPAAVEPEPADRRSRPRRRAPALAGASVVAMLAVFGVTRFAGREPPLDALRVDLAAWENRTGDPRIDGLGPRAADHMQRAIAGTGAVKDVRRHDPGAPSRAGTLVTGAFDRDGPGLRFRAWVTDVRRDARVWAVTAVSVPAATPELALDSIRPRVVGAVAALQHARFGALLPLATPPPSFEAYQEFLEGVALQAQGQIRDALQHYRWASGIDPVFTWPQIYGSLVSLYWYRENLTAQVDSFLTALGPERERLPVLQRHLLDHVAAVRAEDWDAAYRAMRAAAELCPQEFSYSFANKANGRNRPREAVDALLRPGLDSIYRTSVRGYWFVLTGSLHMLGEHRSELAHARRARQNAPQSPHALYQEIRALIALGRIQAVHARLDTLLVLAPEEWFIPPIAMQLTGRELRTHGSGEDAKTVFARAIAWHHARPQVERATQLRREQLATLLYLAGRWADADTLFRALAREYPTSVGYPDNVEYLGHLAMIAARRGDRSAALELAGRLKALERFQPLPGQEAMIFRAKIAALLGDPEEAMRLLTAAYGSSGTTELHGDYDLEVLRDYPPFQEFVRPKG